MPATNRRLQKGKRTRDRESGRSTDSTTKKLEPEPEPPTVKPPSSTTDWQANWQESRTISAGQTDPQDSRCRLLRVGEPAAAAAIGNGELNLRGGSPRFYINGQYQNVEFETEILVVGTSSTSQVYLSARSNHERRPEGFGGYPLYIDVTEKSMFFKKELTHVIGYSGRLASVKVPYEAGKWFKARVRITNIAGGKVKCEGWFNDTGTSYTDTGQIKCGTQTNTPPFTGTGESCFFRVNGNADGANVNVKYRNAVIRRV